MIKFNNILKFLEIKNYYYEELNIYMKGLKWNIDKFNLRIKNNNDFKREIKILLNDLYEIKVYFDVNELKYIKIMFIIDKYLFDLNEILINMDF